MKTILEWIRSNLITTISIAVTMVSLGVIVYYAVVLGGAFQSRLEERGNKIHDVNRFSEQTITLPPKQPNEPPEKVRNQTIKQEWIDIKKQVNQQMKGQLEGTLSAARSINQRNHPVLIKGMFPVPNQQQRLDSRSAYLQAFRQMRSALDAGLAPSSEEIHQVLNEVRNRYQQMPGGRSNDQRSGQGGEGTDFSIAGLSRSDRQRLGKDLRQRLRSLLSKRARSMHIYAPPIQSSAASERTRTQSNSSSNQGPFDIGSWAYGGAAPPAWQIWEGQLELWIQQDIVRAIAKANKADDPSMSVVDAPVKRLLHIEVVPGYVGLQTVGGVDQGSTAGEDSRASGRSSSSSNSMTTPDRGYPPPAGGQTGDANDKITGNYYLSHTGHRSNAVYDVRHARLSIIADVEKLPRLFESLSDTNFMTVLDMRIENVNEYQALREGYYYGNADVARVDMVIETLWLRDWTRKLMPEATKVYVGLKPAPKAEQQNQQRQRRRPGRRYRR